MYSLVLSCQLYGHEHHFCFRSLDLSTIGMLTPEKNVISMAEVVKTNKLNKSLPFIVPSLQTNPLFAVLVHKSEVHKK